jgi:ribosomal protein S21
MALQVTKKEKETSQNLVHRFTKVVRQSGVLLEIRKGQFYKRAKSALAKKRSALRKVEVRAEKRMADKLAKPK